jgi:hypothetical protein
LRFSGMKQRIYIDTSVIGGCEDIEFSTWSIRLFEEFRKGLRVAVVSDLTRRELEKAPESVKNVISSLPDICIENVFLADEAKILAQHYVNGGAVTARHIVDAQHITIASVERVDVLVSWELSANSKSFAYSRFQFCQFEIGLSCP